MRRKSLTVYNDIKSACFILAALMVTL